MKLKNEIDLRRKYIKINQKTDSIVILTNNEYSFEIDQWTTDDVKLFLISKNLNSLLPILCEMNGKFLHELYKMCLSNRESMFHTLQREISILNVNNQSLTLLIYLRFLNEIQKYIP
ncbi:unnamed protein product [Rotaria sordida]|uniref:Uncharacterized protein n=1 Tax=Rotaria sordida TaxID=392033 RepID=A0A819P7D2_9BILA|nr:unnamed protein product [Rotaria sordida]CAF1334050.1 unnamed protein product [Rotaria sordida]CAF4008117.1 unnamed protein product [Rotaria sordida]CAF4135553.1 unnamed protein product [Rotaria sordida]